MTNEDRERSEKGRAMADELMRAVRGPDGAVEDRVEAVVASSRQERIRFVLESAKRLREFLVEAEWRGEALRAIQPGFRSSPDDDADDLECTFDTFVDAVDSFRDFVLFGEGHSSGTYFEPQGDILDLEAAVPEFERRLAENDRRAANAAIARRMGDLVAEIANCDPAEAERLAVQAERLVEDLERRRAEATAP